MILIWSEDDFLNKNWGRFLDYITVYHRMRLHLCYHCTVWYQLNHSFCYYYCHISWTTIVAHGRDDREVGVAHEAESPKNQPQFLRQRWGKYWLGKPKPKKLSDWPEMLSKCCHGILKICYLMEFSTDWLTN